MANPFPFSAVSANSKMRAATCNDFNLRSSGASLSFFKTAKQSFASKAGPMPLPIGWLPSVIMTSINKPIALPTAINFSSSKFASSILRTFAVGPTGISITTCVDPAAAFFDKTEAIIWPSLSISKVLSTDISTSSAGLKFTDPPQAIHPPSFSTTDCIVSKLKSTGVITSIVSAVPAGDVIALDEVFGKVKPAAVTMATTIGVVLFPGKPPTQCLSTTISLFQFRRVPLSIIAFVRPMISANVRLFPEQAVINADNSTPA